jgi:hypothetical protein
MLMASPYVNNGVTQLTELIPRGVSRTLVTRTDLRDFALGASNLETLCILARDGVTVRSLSALHAKIYIFDDTSALVTSANATYGGMHRNWECGLGTSDTEVVGRLTKSLLRGLGANRPPYVMDIEELEALRVPLSTIKAAMPDLARFPKPAETAPTPDAVFSVTNNMALLEGFEGWLRLTLRGVMAMPKTNFRLEDLRSVCAPFAAREYPRNHHVPDKLRQQLQRLRDLGIVEFIDRGIYRLTLDIDGEGR